MNTPGVGPVLAARLVGRVGRASRFATAAAFANYTGAAPVEIASADKARHRLSRSGDRQLNSVLHTIAVTQIRMPNSPGHAYYQRKLSEGKTPREAKRCLKRRLADHVWRIMTPTSEGPNTRCLKRLDKTQRHSGVRDTLTGRIRRQMGTVHPSRQQALKLRPCSRRRGMLCVLSDRRTCGLRAGRARR
ncbi:transposase [Streptomyces mirabilis]|uniref:transposase n=1 Tax=Streptomyces mirabilis TaxID=68239 RepID=UPI0036516E2C